MNIGRIQVALAGFCFGFLGIFGKLAFQRGIQVGELLTLRFGAAAAVLFFAMLVARPKLLKISFREIVVCAALGCLGYAVFATLYFSAIEGLSVALASLLLYTFPIMVSLGAHFLFKERLTKAQWIAIPVTTIGLVILLSNGNSVEVRSPFAIAAGLGSALCYSIYILASSKLQKSIDPLTSALYVIAFAALALASIQRPSLAHVISFGLEEWLIVLGIAIICTVAPLFLFLSGLQKLGNTQASLFSLIEPVTAAVMGAFFLHEPIGTQLIVGGALVLAGLSISISAPNR
jgi:DME family drug/metabolite transporter